MPLKVLAPNTALLLKAIRDIDGRSAGDEWLFEGPGTYVPRTEAKVVEERVAVILKPNTGLLVCHCSCDCSMIEQSCCEIFQFGGVPGEQNFWLKVGESISVSSGYFEY